MGTEKNHFKDKCLKLDQVTLNKVYLILILISRIKLYI